MLNIIAPTWLPIFLHSLIAPSRGGTDETSNFIQQKETFPRYHVIHSKHETKTVRVKSPFLVANCLTDIIEGLGSEVTKMANDDLLLEVRDKLQHSKLTNLVAFEDIPISVRKTFPFL